MAEKKASTFQKHRSGWLAAAGVTTGVLVYVWYKRRQAASAAGSSVATIPTSMPAGASDTSTTVGTGANTTTGTPQFNSLQDWMSHVQTWANSVGFDAAAVQTALQNYSLGNCVDSTGYKVIDQAIGLFGQPPSAPYQGVVLCQPAPTTPGPITPQNQLVAGVGAANATTWLPRLWQAGNVPQGTIPVYGSTGTTSSAAKIVGYIPFGTLINPTGPTVSSPWGPGGGTVQLIPVGNGQYVGTADVGVNQPPTGTTYTAPANTSTPPSNIPGGAPSSQWWQTLTGAK